MPVRGFPFFFYFLEIDLPQETQKISQMTQKNIERWKHILSITGMTIVGLAVILSGSRAGMLALAAVIILGFFYLFQINKTQKILLGFALILSLSSLYFIKRDSANGRLLIWHCSWEMIKEKPFNGFGTGGFKANYMNYQAKYFEENPNDKQAILADNINHPFNEYIGLIINYGLIGFLCFLIFLFLLIRAFRKNANKTLFSYIAASCLTAIAVFALFSYPLRYPFVWTVGLMSCLIILFQSYNKTLKIFKTSYIVSIIILLITSVVCIKSYGQLKAEMKWCKVAHLSLTGETEQMLPEYQALHSKLYNNELFLYNYAAELNFSKHYEESLSVAQECERIWADYDLQMLIADNYQQLKDYTKAEQYYLTAAAMCPVKLTPLYSLAKMYEETGRQSEAVAIAQQILSVSQGWRGEKSSKRAIMRNNFQSLRF